MVLVLPGHTKIALELVQIIVSLMECASTILIRNTAVTHEPPLDGSVYKHAIGTAAPAWKRHVINTLRTKSYFLSQMRDCYVKVRACTGFLRVLVLN